MTLRVLTAYNLESGHSVWLSEGGAWSEYINSARISKSDDDNKEMENQAELSIKSNEIFGIYWVDVLYDSGIIKPLKYREILRTLGPTTHINFGPQSTKQDL